MPCRATNDDLTLVLAAWPQAEAAQIEQDLQGNYLREVTANLGDRLDGGRQETRIVGEGVPNRFHKPYGPGWALVGDAGYAKDPVTAQGTPTPSTTLSCAFLQPGPVAHAVPR